MKKILAMILSLLMMLCLGQTTPLAPKTATPTAQEGVQAGGALAENYIGADFSYGEIAYILDRPIDVTINTFSALIRMEKNHHTESYKSVVFGSYCYYNKTHYANLEVNVDGNVVLSWTNTNYVFASTDVRTGEWVHISVVRDLAQGKLHLYVDGVLAETLDRCPTTETTGNYYRQRIGGDSTESARKYGFWGEIGHVSCYADARTADEIAADYADVRAINHFTRGDDLLFSVMLALGDNIAYDKSANFNHARIITNDYYYDGEWYEPKDYSFAIVGDPQRLAQYGDPTFDTTTQWIVDHKEEQKIASAFFLGDLTNGTESMTDEEWAREWINAQRAINVLDNKVPYIVTPGNHDYPDNFSVRDLTEYNRYFPYEKYTDDFYHMAGAYEVGQIQNTYYTYNICGINYLLIAMETHPEETVLQWVCDVLEAHPNHRGVIITHSFLTGAETLEEQGSNYISRFGEEEIRSKMMWEKYFSHQENLFMILCGHTQMETLAYHPLKGVNGNTTMAFRIDPSCIVALGGLDSILAMFHFDEANTTISINYFSVDKNLLYNVQNQMQVNFSDFTRLTAAYYGEEDMRR